MLPPPIIIARIVHSFRDFDVQDDAAVHFWGNDKKVYTKSASDTLTSLKISAASQIRCRQRKGYLVSEGG